jgi:glycosyltransferase involved in cell wall biosynthesis
MTSSKAMTAGRPGATGTGGRAEDIRPADLAGHVHRVAVVMHDMRGGGAERMMINLASGFADLGLEVDLVAVRAEGPLTAQIDPRVRLVDLDCGRTVRSIGRLSAYLRRSRPDVAFGGLVHINTALVLANLLAGRPTRVVVSERNTTSIDSAAAETLAVRLAHKAIPAIYRLADGIATVSGGVADDLAASYGLARDRIEVLHNPVVTPSLERMAGEEPGHPWLAPGQPPVILGAGRLAAQKDFPTLLRAFAKVKQTTECRLIIVGEGTDREALEGLARQLGIDDSTDLPGYQANPYAWMRRAAVFVLSSRWEGSPNALVEAMACGTPVVATDCPNGPREITENGQWGRLVEMGDVDGMAKAIADTLQHPADSEALIDRASTYRQERSAQAHLTLFDRIMARRR